MIITIKKLLYLLTPKDRRRGALILFMTFLMAIFDVLGIVSIFPFIAVLTDPSIIETNYIMNNIYNYLSLMGIKNNNDFFFVLGILIFILLVFSILFRAFTVYLKIRFVQNCDYNIGKRLTEAYLHQPYVWFLNQNSSELGKNILSEVSHVAIGGINQLIELISKSLITILIIFLLIAVNPKIAFTVFFFIGGIYMSFYLLIRISLKVIGKKRFKFNELRYRLANEVFSGIKEVKIRHLKYFYINRFSIASKIFFDANSNSNILTQLPRFFLEVLIFGGSLALILYMIKILGSFNSALPLISLYIFAGYRLMPAIQSVYSSFSLLTFNTVAIDKLYSDFKNLKLSKINDQNNNDKLILKNSISLNDVFFTYPNTKIPAIKNINLNISVNSNVGFIGTTGSGKTTIIDIILGLLEAQQGQLKIDGQIITKENLANWQRTIGYVPQQIYLTDDTLASNIAFGEKSEDINQDVVEKVSKIAHLHDFVENELPNKYQTKIGERGVRLSGGQRQRIGIARALYHNPKLLVLDEATSALDNNTERMVIDSLNALRGKITIITIAHRLNTLKNCDTIYKLDKGTIVDKVTYDQIIKH